MQNLRKKMTEDQIKRFNDYMQSSQAAKDATRPVIDQKNGLVFYRGSWITKREYAALVPR